MRLVSLLIPVLFIVSLAASAEVTVNGAVVNDSHCNYYSTMTGHFSVSFYDREQKTRWGDKVFVQYGFMDSFNQQVWTREQSVEMQSMGPYYWNVQFRDLVSSRGSFGGSQLDFIIRIEHEDGTKSFDNGSGTRWGYYYIDLGDYVCEYPEHLPLRELHIVEKN